MLARAGVHGERGGDVGVARDRGDADDRDRSVAHSGERQVIFGGEGEAQRDERSVGRGRRVQQAKRW